MKILNRFKKNPNNIIEKNNTVIEEILEWFFCIIIAIIIALFFRYFIATPTVVKKTSMYPTLVQDQRLLLNRWSRTTHQIPKRGDIITFEAPSTSYISVDKVASLDIVAKYENEPNGLWNKFAYYVLEINKTSFIKRVIGLPGEHIKIENGKVYINDEELQEKYLQENVKTEIRGQIGLDDFIVPDNCVFAMGDNRGNSMDCRDFGCIPINKIESIVLFRFWPINKFTNFT